MELPRKVLIGDGVIRSLGAFIRDLGHASSKIAFISGNTVEQRAGDACRSSFQGLGIEDSWYIVVDSSIAAVYKLKKMLAVRTPDLIIGLGGGRSVDVAKMTAFELNRPCISVPTSASHDGISSPFVSIRGKKKPYSVKANTPVGVLADTSVLAQAPSRLMASGCGDLVAKFTAVKDWQLARDEHDEYFGSYAANLADMSAKIILSESRRLMGRGTSGI